MRNLVALLALLIGLVVPPASADWRRVRTDHFILVIDDTEEAARDFGLRLERFDAALRLLYGVADNPDQYARPITIYALKEQPFYAACRCPGIYGYYRSRSQGSYILSLQTPKTDAKAKVGGWSSQAVLLHEYSHHFTFHHFPIAYPAWFTEGFAEFNANVTFEPDGAVVLGYPVNYRAQALKEGRLAINRLLDPERLGYDGRNPDLFYGRGWLLTHYLMLNKDREGQLAAYLRAMNAGKTSIAAAEAAFGDLGKLDNQLDAYQRGYLLPPLRIPPAKTIPAIAVATLSPGEAEMLPSHLIFADGIGKGYQLGPLLQARKVAARYPDEAIVQAQLAEAEFLSERYDLADQAADRALAIDADQVTALAFKGTLAVKRAKDAKSSDPAVWKAARAWFLKANRADPNAVPPLYGYFAAFVAEGRQPSADAVRGLMRAGVLAPESSEVRLALARHMLATGDAKEARAQLQPLAFRPHRAAYKNLPRTIVDLIDAGKIDEARKAFGAEADGDRD